MNQRILEAGIPFKKDWVDLADKVVLSRPPAIREHDQIYMMSGSMIMQTILMHDYLADKHIVFMGDGDGMSMMFGIFSKYGIVPMPRLMTVLDMDKRTLNNIKKFAINEGFGDRLETFPYNVFDPIPIDLVEKADIFYTNPPYGSKNNGKSGIAFLSRCMELTKRKNSFGIVILPYETNQPWSISAMFDIQTFLVEHGYSICEMIGRVHKYHLPDNPILTSGYMIIDRVKHIPHSWTGKTIPSQYLFHFYGNNTAKLPHIIQENGSIICYEKN